MGYVFFPSLKKTDKVSEQNLPFNSKELLNRNVFSKLFNQHPDSVFTLETDGSISLYNQSLLDKFGYSESSIKNKFAKTFFNKQVKKYFNLTLNGTAQHFIANIFHTNGNTLTVDITFVPLFDEYMNALAVYGIAKNITVNVQREKELNNIVTKFELAQKCGKIGSWEYDIDAEELYWSNQIYELTGTEKSESYISKIDDGLQFVHPDDFDRYKKLLTRALVRGTGYSIEYRIVRKNQTFVYVAEQVEVLFNELGKPTQLIGNTQDISQQKMTEMELRDAEKRIEHISNHLSLGIWSYDIQKEEISHMTTGIESITGYPLENFNSFESWTTIIHPEDYPKYQKEIFQVLKGRSYDIQYRIFHKNGTIVWIQDKSLPVLDEEENVIRIDGIISNIHEQKQNEEMINKLAFNDSLTDLPNRTYIINELKSLIDKNITFSYMHLDINRFRNINSTLGHSIADKLLQQFCDRVKTALTNDYLFARLNGDKFGLLIWNYEPSNLPETTAQLIIDSLQKPFSVDGFEMYVTTSIGISNYPSNGKTVEEILSNANSALYRAKAVGNSNYHIYSSTLNITSFKQYELERDLRKSIEKNELEVYYQPRVDTKTGRIVSAEALLRWQHPVWGIVSPNEFIPIAEESGFINTVGDWVLKQVCQHIAKWKREKVNVVPISINTPAQRFLQSDWITVLLSTLKENDVDPSLLEIEITETTLMQHEREIEFAIDYLKKLGVKVALDDFGTGYSSLTHIKDFKIDTIKIDKSFIKQISKTPNVEIIVKSIIFMAKGLKMNIVAEGVETAEQLEFLRHQECSEIQGYLFSEAVTEQKFKYLLEKMILKPILKSENIEMDDRRSFYRIELLFPLSSEMTLTSFQGKLIKLGKTEVVVENIGAGGLKFISPMQLPVRPDVIYQFETVVLNNKIIVNGTIVWKKEVRDGFFQYGVEFSISENDRNNLLKVLNNFSLQLKKNAFVSDCNFIQEDKFYYLKKANQN